MVIWKVEVHDEKGACKGRFAHSTFQGMLISKEDLVRTSPGFVPRLTPHGQARLTVLKLCDGATPLAKVETEVFRLHSDLFETLAEAAFFTAEVVTRYTSE